MQPITIAPPARNRFSRTALHGFCAGLACTAVLVASLVSPPEAAADCGVAHDSQPHAVLPAGDVGMLNVDGEEVTIDSIRGEHGTLVIFSCNACPWAIAWEERIAELGNSARKEGVGVIVVNSNDPGRVPKDGYKPMQERAKEKGFEFPYVVDATSGVARAYGASRTPECFLYDEAGKLVYHGAVDDNAKQPAEVDEQWLADAISTLLEDKEVSVVETKAIGCSIKFRSET